MSVAWPLNMEKKAYHFSIANHDRLAAKGAQ